MLCRIVHSEVCNFLANVVITMVAVIMFISKVTCSGLCVCSKGHLIALDVIRGLVFLHSNKVVHADLKAKTRSM